MTLPDISAFDLASLPPGFHADPFPWYAALVEDAPVHPQPDGSMIVSRWADLDMIYRDTKRFLSGKKEVFRPKYGDSPLYEHHTTSLVFSDPPLHTRVRKIMVGAMTPRAIARMEPGLVSLVDRLLDQLEDAGKADLIEDYASQIPIEVIGNLFDIPHSERGPLRDWSLAILGALEPVLTQAQLDRGNRAVTDFKAYLKDLADHRRRHPGDPDTDVLTRLMQGGEEKLSETELLQNCIFILNAGHETTTNLIGNSLCALCDDRDARAHLLREPTVIETAVDEFLRFLSPNQFGNRETSEEVEVAGVTIPLRTNLHLAIGAANRDPRQFDDPHRLHLDRRPNKHHAFAGGPHLCVGFTLARMEGRIAIGRFLDRFPRFDLAGEPTHGGRVRFRGFAHLPAVIA